MALRKGYDRGLQSTSARTVTKLQWLPDRLWHASNIGIIRHDVCGKKNLSDLKYLINYFIFRADREEMSRKAAGTPDKSNLVDNENMGSAVP